MATKTKTDDDQREVFVEWDRLWGELISPSQKLCDDNLISRQCIDTNFRGWDGLMIPLCSKVPLTFYPSTGSHRRCFSDKLHRSDAAIIQPTCAFWKWLVQESACPEKGWQMRGGVKLTPSQIASLVGQEFCQSLASGSIEIKNISLWAGSGETRTPLHVDWVHALIIQVCGKKRWFLSTEESVEKAVDDGRLPRAVIEEGSTHNFAQEDRSQTSVFQSFSEGGSCSVVLEEGDAMLLPAGVYHDVEARDSAALSLTIRFKVPGVCDRPCSRPHGHWGQHLQTDNEIPTQKSLFDKWRTVVSSEAAAENKTTERAFYETAIQPPPITQSAPITTTANNNHQHPDKPKVLVSNSDLELDIDE